MSKTWTENAAGHLTASLTFGLLTVRLTVSPDPDHPWGLNRTPIADGDELDTALYEVGGFSINPREGSIDLSNRGIDSSVEFPALNYIPSMSVAYLVAHLRQNDSGYTPEEAEKVAKTRLVNRMLKFLHPEEEGLHAFKIEARAWMCGALLDSDTNYGFEWAHPVAELSTSVELKQEAWSLAEDTARAALVTLAHLQDALNELRPSIRLSHLPTPVWEA